MAIGISPGLQRYLLKERASDLGCDHFTSVMEPSQQAYWNFQRRVDRLCLLIVASDCSNREIDIERLHLRVQAATLFPEKMPLYDMVYESRFRRLRQQFRERS
jgi:hypothetical protein